MKFSLCIPMYNEAAVIEETAKTLSQYMSENFEDYEILFSDDGSLDGSAELVKGLSLPCVRVVGYPNNQGKGRAIREAVLAAEGDVIMFTDADLAYGTDVIGKFARAMEDMPNTDVLVGSRNLSDDGYEEYTLIRKLASKAYIKLLSTVGGLKLSDSQCGCKAFRRDAAKRIFPYCEVNGFAFDFEVILLATRMKMEIQELAVKVINHRGSKVNVVSDALRMTADVRKIKRRIKHLEF